MLSKLLVKCVELFTFFFSETAMKPVLKGLNMSYPAKLSIFGASVGIALIAVLASYFRRRRRKVYKDITDLSEVVNGPVERPASRGRGKSPASVKNHNGGTFVKATTYDYMTLIYSLVLIIPKFIQGCNLNQVL